jgi:hypothetical protein
MKTITEKQPWGSLIVEGVKDIENRTWKTNFRGRVLIHAGSSWDKSLAELCLSDPIKQNLERLGLIHKYEDENIGYKGYSFSFPHGAIIGSVEIVDCVINHHSIWAEKTKIWDWLTGKIRDYKTRDYKPIYNWMLANPIKFLEPIPAKGKLSFWDYPNILAEPEEKGGELFCHCQLPVKEENQVLSMGDGTFRCRYCLGKWYK